MRENRLNHDINLHELLEDSNKTHAKKVLEGELREVEKII